MPDSFPDISATLYVKLYDELVNPVNTVDDKVSDAVAFVTDGVYDTPFNPTSTNCPSSAVVVNEIVPDCALSFVFNTSPQLYPFKVSVEATLSTVNVDEYVDEVFCAASLATTV